MTSHLDALVELNKQVAVEEPRVEQEQQEAAEREIDDQSHPFDRKDFLLLMISNAILVLGVWWVVPL